MDSVKEKRSNMVSLLCVFLVAVGAPMAMGEPLTVSYLERPPYYYTQRGKAAGTLIELASEIFNDAGIEISFKPMPPKRIMRIIRGNSAPHCSVGWFKKPEREEFAKFSLPFYRNRPITLLTSADRTSFFASYQTLREVFSDDTLVMATISSFSYGPYIDELIKELPPKIHEIPGERIQLVRLIKKGRASYLLTAPEETEMLVKSAGFSQSAFVSIPLKDIPVGNKRYLMCSKKVSDKVIERFNRSLLQFVDDDIVKD